MAKQITVTVQRSSHPDFEYIGYTFIGARQLAKSGELAKIEEWIETLKTAAAPANVTVNVVYDL